MFRGGAILFGLSLLAVIEIVCRVAGVGELALEDPALADDPFVGFHEIRPLFERNESGDRFEIPAARLKFFAPESFPAVKEPGTFRIFVLGGSTVQGRPFSIETSFTTWLENGLNTTAPERSWEVVNCGGISYASYRLVPVLDECLGYDPDLIVLCTGHNEFLEDRTYGHVRDSSPAVATAYRAFSRLRSFQLLRATLIRSSAAPPAQLTAEVDAMLDYEEGTAAYHRDDGWREGIVNHFRVSIARMIATCQSAKVPLVIVSPPVNLRSCPPFKSQHRDGLSASDLRRWEERVTVARSHLRAAPQKSVAALREALALDDQMASLWFELGMCQQSLGQFEPARESFLRAKELDVCPLRMLESMRADLSRLADESAIPLLDAHRLLERQARYSALGDDWLFDHVHPSFAGHREIAIALIGLLEQHEIVDPVAGWREQIASLNELLGALPPSYFTRGEQNLAGLRAWTQGRADGPPIEQRFPHRIKPSPGAR